MALVLSLCSGVVVACGRPAPVTNDPAPSAASRSPESAPVVDVGSASDEFNDPATRTSWVVMQGELPDGEPSKFDIGQTTPGTLTLVPSRSWWVNGTSGFFIYKQIRGDFTVTVRIRASGKAAETPTVDWSLTGLLIRSPVVEGATEHWVGYTVGFVGHPTLERKTTKSSHSELRLIPVEPGWIELRVVRSGPLVILMRRHVGTDWALDAIYERPELAQTLQVGIDAQSGYGSDRTDHVAEADWIRFAPTGIPAGATDGVLGQISHKVGKDNGNALSDSDTGLVRQALWAYVAAD
jgi:hypothetical protein